MQTCTWTNRYLKLDMINAKMVMNWEHISKNEDNAPSVVILQTDVIDALVWKLARQLLVLAAMIWERIFNDLIIAIN